MLHQLRVLAVPACLPGAALRRMTIAAPAALAAAALVPMVAFADTVAGTGYMTGTVSFDQPYAVCPNLSSDHFTFSGTAQLVAVDVDNTVGYRGPVTVNASGGGVAACDGLETGSVTASASGQNGVQQINCVQNTPTGTQLLSGAYVRVGTQVHVQVQGICTIDNFTNINVTIYVDGEFTPSDANSGNGITAPITRASYTGLISFEPDISTVAQGGCSGTPLPCGLDGHPA